MLLGFLKFNNIYIIIYKFNKRVLLLTGYKIYRAKEQVKVLLRALKYYN